MIDLTEYEANLLRRFLRVDYIEYTNLDEAELATCQRLRKEHGLLGGDFVRFCRNDKTWTTLLALDELKKKASENRAAKEEQAYADRAQILADKKHDRRHDFFVAAFSVAATLFAEHIGDIIDFSKVTAEKVLVLLGLLH